MNYYFQCLKKKIIPTAAPPPKTYLLIITITLIINWGCGQGTMWIMKQNLCVRAWSNACWVKLQLHVTSGCAYFLNESLNILWFPFLNHAYYSLSSSNWLKRLAPVPKPFIIICRSVQVNNHITMEQNMSRLGFLLSTIASISLPASEDASSRSMFWYDYHKTQKFHTEFRIFMPEKFWLF